MPEKHKTVPMRHRFLHIHANAKVAMPFFLLAVAILQTVAEGRPRTFTHGGAGLAEPHKADVWNMSGTEELDRGRRGNAPRYKASQDPARKSVSLSEIVDGRRMRYRTDSTGTRWTAEETALMCIVPDTACYTNVFDFSGHVSGPYSGLRPNILHVTGYTAHGRYCDNAHVAEQGVYSDMAPVYGRIIFGADTVDAVMTAETRRYTADLSCGNATRPLDAVRDSLEAYTVTRYRWYSTVQPGLPIAVQTDISSRFVPDGSDIASSSTLYTLAPEDLRALCVPAEGGTVEETVASIKARYSDGGITLSAMPGCALDLSVGVSSLTGVPYYNTVVRVAASGEPREITLPDLPVLPSGRYMLGVSAASTPEVIEKQYIIVP